MEQNSSNLGTADDTFENIEVQRIDDDQLVQSHSSVSKVGGGLFTRRCQNERINGAPLQSHHGKFVSEDAIG